MEDMNKSPDSTDAQLRELIEWMLDSISVRNIIKLLVQKKEENDNIWINEIEQEIRNKYN